MSESFASHSIGFYSVPCGSSASLHGSGLALSYQGVTQIMF